MAVDPEAVLARVRAAKGELQLPTPAEVRGKDPLCVGCPPHLLPGQKCVDPVTGLEGEVVAYARTIVPGEIPEAG